MGRGGAKLGKDVKGAGFLNDADRAALAAGQVPVSGGDETATDLDHLQLVLDQRRSLAAALKAKAAEFADPIAARQVEGHWRRLRRRHRRHALLAQLGALRFQVERRALADDLRRRDLADTTADLTQLGRRAAQRHGAQLAALIDDAYVGPVMDLVRAEDGAVLRLAAAIDAELGAVTADQSGAKQALDVSLQSVAKERVEGDDEATAKLEMEREQIRGANVEAINELRVVLDRVVDDLEQRFDAAHAAYQHGTDERQREFRALFGRDAQLSSEIGKRMGRVAQIGAEISVWRKKAARQAQEAAARNQALDRERSLVQSQFYDLKRALARVRDQARHRIKAVALRSRQARRQLGLHLDQAARLLALAERARLRDRRPDDDDDELQHRSRHPMTLTDLDQERRAPLRHLFARLSRAELARQHARQKRDWLRKENVELRQALRDYMDQVTVPAHVLDQNNSLVVINGRHNLLDPISIKSGIRSYSTTDETHPAPATIAR